MPFKLDIPLIHLNEGRLPRARTVTEYDVVSDAVVTFRDIHADEVVRHSSVEALDGGSGGLELPYLRVGGKVMRPFAGIGREATLASLCELVKTARREADPTEVARRIPLDLVAPSRRVEVARFQKQLGFFRAYPGGSLKAKNVTHDGYGTTLDELQTHIDTEMAVVDDNVYVAAPEPTWQVAVVHDQIRLSCSSNDAGFNDRAGLQGRAQFHFAASRHDDAREFAERCSAGFGRPLSRTGNYALVPHEDDAPLSFNPLIFAAAAIAGRSEFSFAFSAKAKTDFLGGTRTSDSAVDTLDGLERHLRSEDWFLEKRDQSLAFFDAFRAYMDYVSPHHLPDDLKPIPVVGGGLKLS